ncbi:helix-turn-helix domain-containing protein [Erysipelothrix rhusiopathiae]|uniref:helix-turn-helix domain-containing protein n=1 Tax=Erysipelothrix rhusiopathiae TaxID=1648 RepID=UPI0024807093|nr:helix-turn-helix transcriptional regulator [Erysipelothrix rhusiopathiae]
MKTNLKKLRTDNKKTQKDFFADLELPVELDTYIKYEQGVRDLPVDLGIEIADKYGVSLDWLYCRSDFKQEKDSMVKVISALYKVLSVGYRKTPYADRDVVLLMDNRFAKLINDIRDYEYFANMTGVIDRETYNNGRKAIFEKYEEYFKELLGEAVFTEYESLAIYGVESASYKNEDDTILNYLGSNLDDNGLDKIGDKKHE